MAKKDLPSNEEIRAQAYQIYLARGCGDGHAEDDWSQAEYELMHLPVHKLAKLELPKRKLRNKVPLVSLVQAAVVFASLKP